MTVNKSVQFIYSLALFYISFVVNIYAIC